MAKLLVTADLLIDRLFQDPNLHVAIVDASFDGGCIVLDIEGESVPEAESVIAIVHVERMHVEFEAV